MSVKTKEKLPLLIDTSDNLRTIVQLGETRIMKRYRHPREQELLTLIDEVMRRVGVSFNQIKEIKINLGPGSFTGIRVGVSVANVLAWCLNIKVNGRDRVVPRYK